MSHHATDYIICDIVVHYIISASASADGSRSGWNCVMIFLYLFFASSKNAYIHKAK